MPLSLKSHLKKFAHKGQITQEEYDALIKKLEGHDKEIRSNAIDEFTERISVYGTYDYHGNKIDVLEIAEQLKESE